MVALLLPTHREPIVLMMRTFGCFQLTTAYGGENANPFATVEKDVRIFFHTIDKNELDLVSWDTQLIKQGG